MNNFITYYEKIQGIWKTYFAKRIYAHILLYITVIVCDAKLAWYICYKYVSFV